MIVKPSFVFINSYNGGTLTRLDGVKMLRHVERMARLSHRSEDKQTEDSWDRFLKAVVIGHGDWSVTEHASFTALLRVDRGVTHELVRHRLFSFTQESTRFVRYKSGIDFIMPSEINDTTMWHWDQAMQSAEKEYAAILQAGGSPQQARSVLPNALAATIAVTGNLRNWRHLFLMRTSRETHPDFRRITIPMLEEIKNLIPILYSDIEPNKRQIDNLRLPR